MISRLTRFLLRFRDAVSRQSHAVLKACLGLTPNEQLALALVLGLIVLGLTTRFALRVLHLEF